MSENNDDQLSKLFDRVRSECPITDGYLFDFETLKNICLYTARFQEQVVELCYYPDLVDANIDNNLYVYLIQDGGRLNWASVEDIENCKDINELKSLYNKTHFIMDNKICSSTSIRGAINISNLISGKTIEFRCFRATKDFTLIENSLKFVDRFITEAIINSDIEPRKYATDYAKPFIQYIDESTQHSKERGIKISHYTEV